MGQGTGRALREHHGLSLQHPCISMAMAETQHPCSRTGTAQRRLGQRGPVWMVGIWPLGNAKVGELAFGGKLSLLLVLQTLQTSLWPWGSVTVSFSPVMVWKLCNRGAMLGLGHHGRDPPAAPAAEISQRVSPSLPHPQQI